jgi:dihydroorotate dehydrogenase
VIGLSASLLTRDAASIGAWAARGYDLLTYKTVASTPRTGHPPPHIHWVSEQTLANSVGLPSPAPDVWMPDVLAAKAALAPHQRLWVSVADDGAAALCDALPIDGIELNLSCPNADTAFTPEAVGALTQPVYLKVGFLSRAELNALLERFPNAAGVTAINAMPTRGNVFAGREVYGLSGAVLRKHACEMLKRLKAMGVATVISVGGVLTVADIEQRFEMGAAHVQMCTGAMRNPNLAREWHSRA